MARNNLIQDCAGASLLEFTLVFPIVMMMTFGIVDVMYMLHEWNLANKATYRGARVAIVSIPVAPSVTNLTYNAGDVGLETCYDIDTGASLDVCPWVDVTCSSSVDATCSDGDAFTDIVSAMQTVFPRITAANVQVRYQSTGLGFPGRPGGLPMNVTVSIQCMSHQMFFLGAWAGWFFPPAEACQPARSMRMPTFASTLPSEDMDTN